MTPLDFVSTTANSDYNIPAGELQQALHRPLVIYSAHSEWEVLSYYYDTADMRMVLDIRKKTS